MQKRLCLAEVLFFRVVFTAGKSDSSLALVRTKCKKLYIVAILSVLVLFTHTVCSGLNQLSQSRDIIRFTCWLFERVS